MSNGLILYQTDDGLARVQLRAADGSVWLTQLEIAELFATTKQNVSLHAKNILNEGELAADSVVKESLTTAADGKSYRTLLYSLPLILAIGHRVRSPRGTQFRQWATAVPGETSIKSFLFSEAGGFLACSRWSSEAIPPDRRPPESRTPAGVPAIELQAKQKGGAK